MVERRELLHEEESAGVRPDFEKYVCALYKERGSLEAVAMELAVGEWGVVTSQAQVSRIVKRNGGVVNPNGRPKVIDKVACQLRDLWGNGLTISEIAQRLSVGEATVYRAKSQLGL